MGWVRFRTMVRVGSTVRVTVSSVAVTEKLGYG